MALRYSEHDLWEPRCRVVAVPGQRSVGRPDLRAALRARERHRVSLNTVLEHEAVVDQHFYSGDARPTAVEVQATWKTAMDVAFRKKAMENVFAQSVGAASGQKGTPVMRRGRGCFEG